MQKHRMFGALGISIPGKSVATHGRSALNGVQPADDRYRRVGDLCHTVDEGPLTEPIVFSNESRDGGSVVSDIDAVGYLRSLRAHGHLMGSAGYRAARLKSQSVLAACNTIGAVICSLPGASLRSGARFDLVSGLGR